MKNATEYAKRLGALLRQVRKSVSVPDGQPLDALRQLIHAFLAWETSRNQADHAYTRLMHAVVDVNDLRVTDPSEIVQIIGEGYALARERAERMVRSLRGVYFAEHAVSLERLAAMNKRDAREFLDKLDGMTPFVSASIMLLSVGSHAIPVDTQLVDRLKRDEVVDPDATLEEVQAFLEHHVRAEEGTEAFYCLRAYVERPIKVNLGPSRIAKTTKKTTKSTTKSKAPTKSKGTARPKAMTKSKASTKKKTTKRTTKARASTKKKPAGKTSGGKRPAKGASKKTSKKTTGRKKTARK